MKQLRRAGFGIKDKLEGNPIKKSIQEIHQVLENPFGDKSSDIRNSYLNDLLSHATATVPFYKRFKGNTLKGFPVIRKTEVQSNFENYRSEPFKDAQLHKVSTSGSTGVPFFLYQNALKRKRNTADVLYFMGESEYEVGNRLIELEVWRGHNKRSRLRNYLLNARQFDVTKIDSQRVHEFLSLIGKSKGPLHLIGFTSSLEAICKEIDHAGLAVPKSQIKGITGTSEYLNSYTREALKRQFQSNVYSRYSNEELGIMAHETGDSKGLFKLNWASYYFEILDMEEDKPVPRGEMGRIVVTDLFNYAMPMIRYDTGDIGRISTSHQDDLFMQTVEGRKMDLVSDTKGNVLSSFLVYTLFYPFYEELQQYQFIQEGLREYTVKLNLKNPTFKHEKALILSIQENFGADSQVNIEYVDEIPRLSSGKRRKVVNRYKSIDRNRDTVFNEQI